MKRTLHFGKSRRRGFTLVELIITTGLVGLLAGIAAVTVLRARNKAAETACISNLEQIARAKSIWAFENKKNPSSTVAMTDLHGPNNFLKREPVCPMNGRYTIGLVSDTPLCDQPGHVLLP